MDEETFEAALGELGALAPTFESLIRDTANPTVVNAGGTFNVIPSEATIETDARLLLGRTVDEVVADLLDLIGDAEIEVLAAGPAAADSFDEGLFPTLRAILFELDPKRTPIPICSTRVLTVASSLSTESSIMDSSR